jgi:hypothetical protein
LPRYVRTPIFPAKVQKYLDGRGIGFALVEDCSQAMLLIAADRTINGKSAAPVMRASTDILGGRALGVVSRQHNARGLMDLDLDDFKEGMLYHEWQEIVLDTAEILVVRIHIRN